MIPSAWIRRFSAHPARWIGAALAVIALVAGGALLARKQPDELPNAEDATATATRAAIASAPTFTPSPLPSVTRTALSASAQASNTPTRQPTITLTPTVGPTATPRLLAYSIQAGDTLSGLADEYESSMGAIAKASGIELDDLLHIGQVITIPLPALTATPTPLPTALPTLPGDSEPPVELMILPTLEPDFIDYVVLAGDTLSSISEEFNVRIDHIIQTNQLEDPSALSIGQKLRIPLRPPTPTPLPTPRRLPSPTAGPRYAAPLLLSPADGEALRGAEGGLPLLVWSSVGILKEEEFYLARLWSAGSLLAQEWTKATSWRAPADLAPAGANAPQSYTWSVIVVRRAGRPGEYIWTDLSAETVQRAFTWRP